jgi:hypothetical protein
MVGLDLADRQHYQFGDNGGFHGRPSMKWDGEPLRPDQTRHAVVWHATLDALGYGELIEMPELDAAWFRAFWGDDKATKRIRTWGHKNRNDKLSPHFLCSRGGLGWHTDPGYGRYCLQVQLYNQGFVVHGLDQTTTMPVFTPGLVILLDSWSPHAVSRDPRLPQRGPNKVLAGIDFPEHPDIRRELPKVVEHIPLLALP